MSQRQVPGDVIVAFESAQVSQSFTPPARHVAQVACHESQVTFVAIVAEFQYAGFHMHSLEVAVDVSAVALGSTQVMHCRFEPPSQVEHVFAQASHVTRGKMAEL